MIEIQNVSKRFLGKVDAVKNVSLNIQSGEIFGIVGYSGAGKSTLVRLINKLETCDKGKIIVDGVDITGLNEKELRIERQKMGMIFQNFNLLWSRTVFENVMFPLEISHQENKDKVLELLKIVGLDEKKDSYPSELSGGQKQRVAIARALASNPNILLCDEATSALDPKTTDDILQLLKKINEELHITIIIITHQMEVVQKICHKMAVMANGEVIEEGEVEKIFENPKHSLTRKLIQTVDTDGEIDILHLKEKYPNDTLLRLTFGADTSEEPILANLAMQYQLSYSIVAANIHNTQSGTLGVMYVIVNDQKDTFVQKCLEKKVKVQEI